MPTYGDETLHDRYAREHADHLARLAKMTPEQIAEMELSLHNALAEVDRLRAEPSQGGEAVEVVGYRFFHVDHGYIFRRTHIYEGNPSLEASSLMTVAQHQRILLSSVIRCEQKGAFKICLECGYQDGHDLICQYHESKRAADEPVAIVEYTGYEPANSLRWLNKGLAYMDPGTKLYTHPADQVAGGGQHARDSEELRSLCAARDQYRDLSIKYGDKLSEALQLLTRCKEHLDPHRDAALWSDVCGALGPKP